MKKRFNRLLQSSPVIEFNFLTTAVTSFILIGLSFALYIRSLGFYLDDWPQLYSLVVHGTEGIKTFFLFDGRPFGWWPEATVFKVWGTNPIGWHLTNYLLRWIVGLEIWGVFSQIWQRNKREVFWVVILFSVFPLLNQQSMGLTMITGWFCYALFFFSLLLMVLSVKYPKHAIWILPLSLATSGLNLFTVEYFIGIEFIRPLVLWFALRNETKKLRTKKTIFYWLPFLALAIFYIVWRLFLMENLRNLEPVLFTWFLSNPIGTSIKIINFVIRDLLYMVMAVWYPTLDPKTIDISVPYLAISYFLSVIVGMVFILLFWYQNRQQESHSTEDSHIFPVEGLVIGLTGIVFGCAPGWLIGASVTGSGLWVDRFGLAAMWAAPIVIVSIFFIIWKAIPRKREMVFIVLISLAVGHNFAITNEYKWSTIWQNRVMSQLKWRAPLVKPNTAFLSNYELFEKVGVYPTSFMLNILYPNVQELVRLDYWFFTIHKYFPDKEADLVKGMDIYSSHWYSKFAGYSRDSLVMGWNSTNPHCLWILTENDRYNPGIDDTTRLVLGASNLDRIVTDKTSPWPDVNLFGAEDRNNWCFYYETGDLARQNGDWGKAITLYEEATSQGYKPMHGAELIPFIEAYAHNGQADVAAKLTKLANDQNENMQKYTCDTWNRLSVEITGDPLFNEQYKLISEKDECQIIK